MGSGAEKNRKTRALELSAQEPGTMTIIFCDSVFSVIGWNQTSADSTVRILSGSTVRCLSVKIGQKQVQIRNLDIRKPSRLKFLDFDRQNPDSESGQNPDSAVRRRLPRRLPFYGHFCPNLVTIGQTSFIYSLSALSENVNQVIFRQNGQFRSYLELSI